MQAQTSQTGSEPDAFTYTAELGALPPAAVRVAPPIVALSDDAMLLEAVSTAALDQATLIVCPSADRFIDQLVATTPELALVDAGAVTDLPTLLDSLRLQFPQLQLLVAGPGNVQHQIGRQLSDGTVFRFAHKPASAARLKLFIDAALRARQTRITAEILNAPAAAAVRTDTIHRSASPSRWLAVATIMALLCAAAGYWYQAAPTAPTTPRARTASGTRAAEAEAEQAAIDRSSAERSQRAEQERLAAEDAARQRARAEQARRAAQDATLEPLQPVELQPLELQPLELQPLQSAVDTPAEVEPALAAAQALDASTTATTTTPPVPAISAIMDESRLRRVDFISPRYPLEALRLGVTGDVEMDFTVTPTGDVTDVEVTFALPVGVFEATSIEALSHSRYQPVQRNGVSVAQRAHIRMRYEL
jgi:TonB family protein